MKIIVVGNVKEQFYRNKITEFCKKLNSNGTTEIIELKDESIPGNAGESVKYAIKRKEGEKILAHINNSDYVIALCIEGRLTDTETLRRLVTEAGERSSGDIVFVIGGSLGLSEEVVRRANYRLSFSRMTFPHQLMRVMLLEQLSYL